MPHLYPVETAYTVDRGDMMLVGLPTLGSHTDCAATLCACFTLSSISLLLPHDASSTSWITCLHSVICIAPVAEPLLVFTRDTSAMARAVHDYKLS